jgi:hypothetical protein
MGSDSEDGETGSAYSDYLGKVGKDVPKGFGNEVDTSMMSDRSTPVSICSQSSSRFSDMLKSYKERASSSVFVQEKKQNEDRMGTSHCVRCMIF